MYGGHAGFEQTLGLGNLSVTQASQKHDKEQSCGLYESFKYKLKSLSNWVWGNVGGTLQEGQQNLAGDSNPPVKAVLILPGFLGSSQKRRSSFLLKSPDIK